MTTLTVHTVNAGHGLTIERAERLVEELAGLKPESTGVILDLTGLQHVQVSAGWRLGNALSRFEKTGELRVLVQRPKTYSGDSLRWFNSGEFFRSFTRSGLGIALAAFAGSIETEGEDIQPALARYYTERRGGGGHNHVFVPAVHDGGLTTSREHFAEQLDEHLAKVNVAFGSWTPHQRLSLVELCYEALQNVVEHAFRSPWVRDHTPLSYFALRFYGQLDDAHTAALGPYAASIASELRRHSPDRELLGYVELLVNDTGVGIAARYRQNDGIYAGPAADEDTAIDEALAAGNTVKLNIVDSFARNGNPGHGFTYIANGLRSLLAFAELRSGRRRVTFNSLEPNPGFRIDDELLGRLPGSALQVVAPVLSPQLVFAT